MLENLMKGFRANNKQIFKNYNKYGKKLKS